MTTTQTSGQIADRYTARQAIFSAMRNGRHITFLDSTEFQVSQMHTQICVIRQEILRKGLPYVLKGKWTTFGKEGKRCKEYWIEDID